jgi:DNA repair protein RadC
MALCPSEDELISRALAILDRRIRGDRPVFDTPGRVKDYCRLYFAAASAAGREEFAVLLLDSVHRLVDVQTLAVGTLSQCSVYPREVVKAALQANAAAVVFAHNHPSGLAEPSRADEYLTQTLKSALQLVDVRVLDHFVVGHTVVSFAERGLL